LRVGCPKEITQSEYRVGLVPQTVASLVSLGHTVFIEKDAGEGCGISNAQYENVGAEIIADAKTLFEISDLLIKVKEPIASEYKFLREGSTLFTFLHLAAEPALTKELCQKKIAAIALETIEQDGLLPILKPMSEVAGRMSIQVGAWCLEKRQGGKGVLLGGVPGVARAKVCILGAGSVGLSAAKMAMGLGAHVTILDTKLSQLEYVDDIFHGRLSTLFASQHNISQCLVDADLVVGAVLVKGAKAPKLVERAHLSKMSPGSVIVDVAVDQGGCVETIRRTTHANPIYVLDEIVHYGVANMPGAVPRTSTFALSNVSLDYICALAQLGTQKACLQNLALKAGLNTFGGHITYEAVAKALNLPYVKADDALKIST